MGFRGAVFMFLGAVFLFFAVAVGLVYGGDVTHLVGNISVLWSGAAAPSAVFVPGSDLGAGRNYGPYVAPLMYAMNFSSASSYVSVATSAVGTGDQLTIETWIWPRAVWLGNTYGVVGDVVSSVCNGGGQWGLHINITYYSRPVAIYNPNPYPLDQFQVPVVVDTASLIAQGKMRSDCGDLRFVDQSGAVLPHYIEKEPGVNCGSSTTWVWVRVPSIPAQGSTTIYMTYGDPSAQPSERPDLVFDFWDGFDTLDTSKWTLLGSSNMWVGIKNGVLFMNETSSSGYYQLKSNWNIPFGYVVESRVYFGGVCCTRVAVPYIVKSPSGVVRYDDGVAFGSYYAGVYLDWGADWYPGFSFGVRLTNGSSTLNLKNNFYAPSLPLWAKTALVFTKNRQIAYVYDDSWRVLATSQTSSLTVPDGSYNIVIGFTYSNARNALFGWDWVRVRKFADQMPNVVVGSEYGGISRICVWTGWVTGVDRDRVCVDVSRVYNQVVVMYDRVSGAVDLYGDGSALARWVVPVGAKPSTSGFRVGSDCNSSFIGYIRHVRVYNRALSGSEVLQNYLSPDVPVASSLAVWLAALDASSVSGSTWVDRAGGSSSASISGATYGQYGLFPPYTLELLYYAVPSPERYVYKVGREWQGFLVTHGDGCAITFYVYGVGWPGVYSASRCGWVHAVFSVRPDGADVWINGARISSIARNVAFATNPALWIYLNSTYTNRTAPPAYARIGLYSGAVSASDQVKNMSYGGDPQGLRLLYKALTAASQYYAYAGSWDVSQMRGVVAYRVAGSYADAQALQGPYSAFNIYLGGRYSLGVFGKWTQSDNWRGWVALFSAGGLWLNMTQVGGHGVAAPGQAVRGYAGVYALTYSGGAARLYANGTMAVSWTAQLPSNVFPLQAYLLTPANSGLRALLYYVWISPGVAVEPNGTSACGSLRCTPLDHSAPYPQEKAYFIDFRWSPPISSLGVLPPLPAVAREGGSPGVLTPVTLTGAVKAANAIWGPFGEVCPGRLPNGTLITFGVKYTWQSPSAQPSCSTPLQTAPPAGTISTGLFNATAPVQLYFAPPPIQHPYAANSVPGARFCSLDAAHFLTPFLPVRAPGSTAVTDQWACAPSDYFAGGHVGQSAPGWALIVPVMRVFRVNTTSVIYMGSGSAVLARGGAVPALSVRAVDGRTWSIYTSGAGAVASAGPLQTPPNVSRTGGAVSGVFGAPRSPTTLVSQWWADGVRYYISAAGLADAPVAYISSFTGSPVAVAAELNAPGGYSYYVGVLDNGTYVWAVPLTGPMQFSVYVPAPGYYEVRLYREADRVWGKNVYLSPDTKLIIGPVDIPVFTPVNPVSLVTPVAPKPPVFVPAVSMQMPPHAVGVLMLGIFAAAYVTMREVSLAALITGAVVAALGVLINAPIYGVAGVFLLAFGLWNKSRRQGSS
jgi:hypothetical protein